MSITAEDVRRRLAQAQAPPGGSTLTAEQVRAALRAGGAPGEATPTPAVEDPRGFWDRMKQAGAAIAEPVLETVQGIQELQPVNPAQEARIAATRRGLARVRETVGAAPAASQMAGRALGEIGMAAYPASRAHRAAQALRGLPGVRGRMAQAAAPVVAEAGAVGAVEALKSPEATGIPRGQAAATAAGLTAGTAGAMGLARKTLFPQTFQRTPLAQEEMQALRGAGIEPRIPISMGGTEAQGMFGNVARWLHRRPLASIPPTQSRIQAQQEQAVSDWRDMMFQRAVPEGATITPPGARAQSVRPIRETFEDIDDWYSSEYKQVLDPYTFDVMGPGRVGQSMADAMSNIPGEATQRQVVEKVGDLLQSYADRAGRLTGGKVSQLKKALRNAARLSDDGEVKAGYGAVIDALDSSVEQHIRAVNPAHADRYVALREPYRNFMTLQEAAKGREMGEFSPQDLFKASERKLTQEKKAGIRAQGKGPLQREAERAAQVYETPGNAADANIFQLAALGGTAVPAAAGGIPGAAVSAGFWTPTLLGLTRGGTRYMTGETGWQTGLKKFMEQRAVQEALRAGRIGGAETMAP